MKKLKRGRGWPKKSMPLLSENRDDEENLDHLSESEKEEITELKDNVEIRTETEKEERHKNSATLVHEKKEELLTRNL